MITLVLGGARSGKSAVAERLAARLAPPVTYVATVAVGDDADLARRVEVHRRRRPPSWGTVEVAPGRPGELGAVLRSLTGSVLVDSLGPWVAGAGTGAVDDDGLCAALAARLGDTVVVSEEVGLSVHPSSEAGRHFRDVLGSVNQSVARCADRVLLVVAGRVLPLAAVEDGPDGPGGGW